MKSLSKCLPLASTSEENSTTAHSATKAESTIKRPTSLDTMLSDDDFIRNTVIFIRLTTMLHLLDLHIVTN